MPKVQNSSLNIKQKKEKLEKIRQRRLKSASKYFYDLSKLIFVSLVAENLISEKVNVFLSFYGAMGSLSSFFFAYWVEGKIITKNERVN